MPISVTVTITKKLTTAQSVRAKPVEFAELVPSGRLETIEVQHDAGNLLPKERKELSAFCAFAGHLAFEEVIVRLTGTKSGGVVKVAIFSSAKNEDPPDLVLTVNQKDLAIEVTDFPPDQTAIQEAIIAHQGAGPLPLFHESGCSPDFIKKFVEAGVSSVEPHAAELSAEIVALHDYARVTIGKKDASCKSALLLLFGPVAFDYPEADVIAHVVANMIFQSLKVVVFVRQNKSSIYWTNLA